MYNFIKKVCNKLCNNLFEESSKSCILNVKFKEKLLLLITPSTELKIKINRKVNSFCRTHQNRFWIIYYRLSEKKIIFSCQKCYKEALCQAYISSRIVKHIKRFNIKQESIVFQGVRKNLIENREIALAKNSSEEIINHYTKKILKIYQTKSFDINSGSALIENSLEKIEDKSIKERIENKLKRYKSYQATIILKDILSQTVDSREILKIKPLILIELLHQEKFLHYIEAPIQSRLIDFTRSKDYTNQVEERQEITHSQQEESYFDTDEEIEKLLALFLPEDRIVYKLKQGLKLNNREFLTIGVNLKIVQDDFITLFNSKEKLYIKFSLHHKLDDNSEHFNILGDIKRIKESISQKILNYRKKLQTYSYIDRDMDEMVIKLIYSEPLSVKELTKVIPLTEKQIYKKIAKIREKLKEMVE